MLPARYRMTRSAQFGLTVRRGVRCAEPDMVIYTERDAAEPGPPAEPKVGLVVAKSVGSAVERHRVARRLRHVAAAVIAELSPGDRVVIRALPASRWAKSATLERELRSGLRRAQVLSRNRA